MWLSRDYVDLVHCIRLLRVIFAQIILMQFCALLAANPDDATAWNINFSTLATPRSVISSLLAYVGSWQRY